MRAITTAMIDQVAGRPISALTRAEQVVVWALRHATAWPESRAIRCSELALLVGSRAADLEAAIRGLARAGHGAMAAPLACRRVAPCEQALLDALGAFHANRPGAFAAVLAALGGGDALAVECIRLAAVLATSSVSLAPRDAAPWVPQAAAPARWVH
jgi:hypothetical protein